MLSKTFPVNQIWCRKRIAPCKGIRIPESGTILLRESEILCFGIRNSPQGIPNPTNDWNPESSSTDKYWNSVPGIRNPQRGIQNPRLSRIPLHGAKHRKKQSLWNKNLFLLAHKCSYEATTETFQNFVKGYIYSYNIPTKLTVGALIPETELLRKSSCYKAQIL